PSWRGIAHNFSIEVFDRKESVEFLCKRTGQVDRVSAEELAEVLGDLPLALEQASAYIDAVGLTFAEYLELFQFQRNALWHEEHPPLDYPATVASTWSLSMQRIDEASQAGAELMNLCAYLGPDSIPRSILGGLRKHTMSLRTLPALLAGPLVVEKACQ